MLLLCLPIIFYIYNFGLGIWQEHSDWAVMGSALGGIYTPILAILTLAVLIKQLQLQVQVKNYEQREMSRRLVFEMVEKFATKISEMADDTQVEYLYALSELPKNELQAASLKSELMDIMTLWVSIRAYIINYNKIEPDLSIDLRSIPILHLTFRVCYDIDKAYMIHLSKSSDEPFLYQM